MAEIMEPVNPDEENIFGEVPEGIGPEVLGDNYNQKASNPAFEDAQVVIIGVDGEKYELPLPETRAEKDEAGNWLVRHKKAAIAITSAAVLGGAIGFMRFRKRNK